MNLNDQATQPSQREYRTCACGKRFAIPPNWIARKWCSAKCAYPNPKRTPIQPTEDAIREGYRLIPLTRGMVAVVDVADYERLIPWTWYANPNNTNGVTTYYARRDEFDEFAGKRRRIFMHRFIVNAPTDMLVDHHDHNGLNCRRYNLRIATSAQNNQNARTRANAHGVKGVALQATRKPGAQWRAQISVGTKTIFLGRFATKELAGEAYRKAAVKHFGEFACSESIVESDTIGNESDNV